MYILPLGLECLGLILASLFMSYETLDNVFNVSKSQCSYQ